MKRKEGLLNHVENIVMNIQNIGMLITQTCSTSYSMDSLKSADFSIFIKMIRKRLQMEASRKANPLNL